MKKVVLLLITTLMSTAGYADGNGCRDRDQYRFYNGFLKGANFHREAENRNSDYRDKRYRKSDRHEQHYQNEKRQKEKWGKKRQHDQQGHAQRGWQTVSAFRGRSGKQVTRSIPVHDKVQALSIQGTKRGMVVRHAHAVMGNGRWVRLHNLEGHITHGDHHRQRLNHPRNVQRVVLDIAPDRYKRGYAELKVKRAR